MIEKFDEDADLKKETEKHDFMLCGDKNKDCGIVLDVWTTLRLNN